jgi:hypothetical protein
MTHFEQIIYRKRYMWENSKQFKSMEKRVETCSLDVGNKDRNQVRKGRGNGSNGFCIHNGSGCAIPSSTPSY